MDFSVIFTQYAITLGWALTGAISMALGFGLLIKIFDILSPINEWEEIKKGNYAMAAVLVALILGTAFVVGLTIMPV